MTLKPTIQCKEISILERGFADIGLSSPDKVSDTLLFITLSNHVNLNVNFHPSHAPKVLFAQKFGGPNVLGKEDRGQSQAVYKCH